MYTHYGIPVKVYSGRRGSLERELKSRGIPYTELTLPDKVLMSDENGVKTYILIQPCETDGGEYENAFVTDTWPQDGIWVNLANDIIGQMRGQPPMLLQTRAAYLIREARQEARVRVIGTEALASYRPEGPVPPDKIPEYWAAVADWLKMYYMREELLHADTHDVEPAVLEEIVKYFQ